MVSQKLLITNSVGLHLRPASVLAAEMMKFDSEVTIVYKDQRINAKSMLNIMAACIKCGAEIEIQCSGADELAALQRAAELVAAEFENG